MESGTPRVQYVYTTIAPGSLLSQMIYPNGQSLQSAYESSPLDAMIGWPWRSLLAGGKMSFPCGSSS